MEKPKKVAQYRLRTVLINEMQEYADKHGYTYSEWVSIAIQEKLKREKSWDPKQHKME